MTTNQSDYTKLPENVTGETIFNLYWDKAMRRHESWDESSEWVKNSWNWLASIWNADRAERAKNMVRIPDEDGNLPDFEDALEAAFWEFDARHKALSGPSERDAFKQVLRGLFSMGIDPQSRGLRAELLARRMEVSSLGRIIGSLRLELSRLNPTPNQLRAKLHGLVESIPAEELAEKVPKIEEVVR